MEEIKAELQAPPGAGTEERPETQHTAETEQYLKGFQLFLKSTDQKVVIISRVRGVIEGAFDLQRLKKEGKILDVGTSDGLVLESLIGLFSGGTAVEPDRKATILLNNKKIQGLKVVNSFIQNFAPPDGEKYDFILMSHMLYYLKEDERQRQVERMIPWLKPGGKLVLIHGANIQGERHDKARMMRQLGSEDTDVESKGIIARLKEKKHDVTSEILESKVVAGRDDMVDILKFLLHTPLPQLEPRIPEIRRYVEENLFDEGLGQYRLRIPQDLVIVSTPTAGAEEAEGPGNVEMRLIFLRVLFEHLSMSMGGNGVYLDDILKASEARDLMQQGGLSPDEILHLIRGPVQTQGPTLSIEETALIRSAWQLILELRSRLDQARLVGVELSLQDLRNGDLLAILRERERFEDITKPGWSNIRDPIALGFIQRVKDLAVRPPPAGAEEKFSILVEEAGGEMERFEEIYLLAADPGTNRLARELGLQENKRLIAVRMRFGNDPTGPGLFFSVTDGATAILLDKGKLGTNTAWSEYIQAKELQAPVVLLESVVRKTSQMGLRVDLNSSQGNEVAVVLQRTSPPTAGAEEASLGILGDWARAVVKKSGQGKALVLSPAVVAQFFGPLEALGKLLARPQAAGIRKALFQDRLYLADPAAKWKKLFPGHTFGPDSDAAQKLADQGRPVSYLVLQGEGVPSVFNNPEVPALISDRDGFERVLLHVVASSRSYPLARVLTPTGAVFKQARELVRLLANPGSPAASAVGVAGLPAAEQLYPVLKQWLGALSWQKGFQVKSLTIRTAEKNGDRQSVGQLLSADDEHTASLNLVSGKPVLTLFEVKTWGDLVKAISFAVANSRYLQPDQAQADLRLSLSNALTKVFPGRDIVRRGGSAGAEEMLAPIKGDLEFPMVIVDDRLYSLIDPFGTSGAKAIRSSGEYSWFPGARLWSSSQDADQFRLLLAAQSGLPGAQDLWNLLNTQGSKLSLFRASALLNAGAHVSVDPQSPWLNRSEEEMVKSILWEERFHLGEQRLDPEIRERLLTQIYSHPDLAHLRKWAEEAYKGYPPEDIASEMFVRELTWRRDPVVARLFPDQKDLQEAAWGLRVQTEPSQEEIAEAYKVAQQFRGRMEGPTHLELIQPLMDQMLKSASLFSLGTDNSGGASAGAEERGNFGRLLDLILKKAELKDTQLKEELERGVAHIRALLAQFSSEEQALLTGSYKYLDLAAGVIAGQMQDGEGALAEDFVMLWEYVNTAVTRFSAVREILGREGTIFLSTPMPFKETDQETNTVRNLVWSRGQILLSDYFRSETPGAYGPLFREYVTEVLPHRENLDGLMGYFESKNRPATPFQEHLRQEMVSLSGLPIERIIFASPDEALFWRFAGGVDNVAGVHGQIRDPSGRLERYIIIRSDLDDLKTLATAVHEAAHARQDQAVGKLMAKEPFMRILVEALQVFFEQISLSQYENRQDPFAEEVREMLGGAFQRPELWKGDAGGMPEKPGTFKKQVPLVLMNPHILGYPAETALAFWMMEHGIGPDVLWPVYQYADTAPLVAALGAERFETLKQFFRQWDAAVYINTKNPSNMVPIRIAVRAILEPAVLDSERPLRLFEFIEMLNTLLKESPDLLFVALDPYAVDEQMDAPSVLLHIALGYAEGRLSEVALEAALKATIQLGDAVSARVRGKIEEAGLEEPRAIYSRLQGALDGFWSVSVADSKAVVVIGKDVAQRFLGLQVLAGLEDRGVIDRGDLSDILTQVVQRGNVAYFYGDPERGKLLEDLAGRAGLEEISVVLRDPAAYSTVRLALEQMLKDLQIPVEAISAGLDALATGLEELGRAA